MMYVSASRNQRRVDLLSGRRIRQFLSGVALLFFMASRKQLWFFRLTDGGLVAANVKAVINLGIMLAVPFVMAELIHQAVVQYGHISQRFSILLALLKGVFVWVCLW